MKKRSALLVEPRFRVSCGSRFVFGPGKAALLDHIKQTGSIAEAAKAMAMSYMRAWMLVKNMNSSLAQPLVETVRGGRSRGGAKLTKTGIAVLQAYRDIETKSKAATRAAQDKLAAVLSS